MSIESELISFLENRIPDIDTKDRNADLIAHFYGFRDSPWPTLEETAGIFSLSSRERVRQLIDKYFRNIVQADDIPSLRQLVEIITRKQYWLYSELQETLKGSRLVEANFSIRGLFNLMSDLKMSNDYGIFVADSRWGGLRQATRNSIAQAPESFVIKNSDTATINSIYKKARTLPGQYGLSNLDYLADVVGEEPFFKYRNVLRDLVKHSNFAWFKEDELEMWYMFEDRDNIIVNFSEKVFSLVDECETSRLAEAFHNALRARPQKREHPSLELIKEYLTSSVLFETSDNTITFTSGTDVELSPIERDIVSYLQIHGVATFSDLSDFLEGVKHGRPLIVKATNTSPIVHVNRSRGRRLHEYTLIGKPGRSDDRYKIFQRELGSILNTDEPQEDKARKEQDTLRRWLFEGKDKENCAICGSEHMAAALIAAHKKKRSDCNDRERRDPNIVMAICVFGCDFLYEKRHIVVDEGIVQKGLAADFGTADLDYMQQLLGKKLEDRWLAGDQSYFSFNSGLTEDSPLDAPLF